MNNLNLYIESEWEGKRERGEVATNKSKSFIINMFMSVESLKYQKLLKIYFFKVPKFTAFTVLISNNSYLIFLQWMQVHSQSVVNGVAS